MEFMFSCVPFQVTGDFYISSFGIFTQHLTYVSVLSLNRVTEEFGSFWSSYVALLLSYPGFLCYALCISWFVCLPVLFGDPFTVQSRWLNPQDHSDRREQPQRWYLHGQRTCLPTFKTSEILISLLEGDTWFEAVQQRIDGAPETDPLALDLRMKGYRTQCHPQLWRLSFFSVLVIKYAGRHT